MSPSIEPAPGLPDEPGTLSAPDVRGRSLSFVRRGDRLTPGQQRTWDTDADQYLIDVPRAGSAMSVDPAFTIDPEDVFGRAAPMILEIGSGRGDAIVAAAAAHPEVNFLAVEVYTVGIALTVRKAVEHGVTNLRLVQADAAEFLATSLPQGCAHELWVFFPDPWRKARHRKRRLVAPAFTRTAADVLAAPSQGDAGGTLRLATDWADYGEQMLEVMEASPQFANAHGAGNLAPRFAGRTETGFERKALAAGRTVTDLEYRRM